jgi:hypothetical protein
MAEGRSLTAGEAVEGVLASEHADVLRRDRTRRPEATLRSAGLAQSSRASRRQRDRGKARLREDESSRADSGVPTLANPRACRRTTPPL